MTKYFAVKLKTVDGKTITRQLPNDLQDACRQFRKDNPKTWKTLMTGSLINYTVGAYTEKNHYEPRVRVGYVKSFFATPYPIKARTRGQFLTRDNWHHEFRSAYKFLRHDFRLRNRLSILIDFLYWKFQLRKHPEQFK